MIELTKWLCQFFFDNYVHWAGLVILCIAIFPVWSFKGRTIIRRDDE